MLNVTILACLLILTGCFGLDAVDDDVIDDADGADTGTTIVNTYPQVQSAQLNDTISISQGESLEVLTVHSLNSANWVQMEMAYLDYNCSSIGGTTFLYFSYSNNFAPSDGGSCTYTVTAMQSYRDTVIMYRVWS